MQRIEHYCRALGSLFSCSFSVSGVKAFCLILGDYSVALIPCLHFDLWPFTALHLDQQQREFKRGTINKE